MLKSCIMIKFLLEFSMALLELELALSLATSGAELESFYWLAVAVVTSPFLLLAAYLKDLKLSFKLNVVLSSLAPSHSSSFHWGLS